MPTELKNVLLVTDPTGLSYCLGTLSAGEIKQLTMVPVVSETLSVKEPSNLRLNEDPTDGYQRAGEPKRMRDIAHFVTDRPECVIPPVLLSCRGKWTFTPERGSGKTGRLRADDLAAVIDGQHRLGGLWQLFNDAEATDSVRNKPIPFMAIMNMSLEKERQEFVDINNKQQGVKKSLIRYLARDSAFSGRAAEALMTDEESVFRGRIDEQKARDWTVFLFGAAEECVKEMFDSAIKLKFDPEKNEHQQEAALEFVLKYWQIVSDCFPLYWSDIELLPPIGASRSQQFPGRSQFKYRLLEETGIRAFSRLAGEVLNYSWIEGASSPSWATVEELMRILAESEVLEWVLAKPKFNPDVLSQDPLLKSTGKAGVDRIFMYLKDQFVRALQSK